jgi:hypothetical protein
MRRIYAAARTTIVWLEDEAASSDTLMTTIAKLSDRGKVAAPSLPLEDIPRTLWWIQLFRIWTDEDKSLGVAKKASENQTSDAENEWVDMLDSSGHIRLSSTALNTPQASKIKAFESQLDEFLKRKYWSRMWIIQEVTAAASIKLHCGNQMLDWDDLAGSILHLVEPKHAKTDYWLQNLLMLQDLRR